MERSSSTSSGGAWFGSGSRFGIVRRRSFSICLRQPSSAAAAVCAPSAAIAAIVVASTSAAEARWNTPGCCIMRSPAPLARTHTSPRSDDGTPARTRARTRLFLVDAAPCSRLCGSCRMRWRHSHRRPAPVLPARRPVNSAQCSRYVGIVGARACDDAVGDAAQPPYTGVLNR
jgi:hypothetical protein